MKAPAATFVTMLLASLGSYAQEEVTDDTKLQFCEGIASIAETIMTNRQEGISLTDMLAVPRLNESETARTIIMRAYDQPRFNTEDSKQRSIEDFRNEMHLQCLKDVGLFK